MKYLIILFIFYIPISGCISTQKQESRRFRNFNRALKNTEKVQILDLGGKGINFLPETIGQFECLKVLVLNNNNITYLPSTIGSLSDLEVLYLMFNPIEELPEEMATLKSLKKLVLHGTNITEENIRFLKQRLPDCLVVGYLHSENSK